MFKSMDFHRNVFLSFPLTKVIIMIHIVEIIIIIIIIIIIM